MIVNKALGKVKYVVMERHKYIVKPDSSDRMLGFMRECLQYNITFNESILNVNKGMTFVEIRDYVSTESLSVFDTKVLVLFTYSKDVPYRYSNDYYTKVINNLDYLS